MKNDFAYTYIAFMLAPGISLWAANSLDLFLYFFIYFLICLQSKIQIFNSLFLHLNFEKCHIGFNKFLKSF